MADIKDKSGVFQVTCPGCGSVLWVDAESHAVLKSEKGQRKKGSLDDFIVKEQKRQEEFDRKFDASFELQREKHTQAEEKFKKALERAEKGDDEPEG